MSARLQVDEWDESKTMFSLMDSTIQVDTMKDQYDSFNEYLEVSNDPFLLQYWDESTKTLGLA